MRLTSPSFAAEGTPPRKPCAFVAQPGDLRLPALPKVENAWDFIAIAGDRLALDDGTAAPNRTLVVVDLTTGQMAGTFATSSRRRSRAGPRGSRSPAARAAARPART